jgi:arylsulfate sulfotransferase
MNFRNSRWFLILVLFQTVLAINCGQNQTFNLVQPNGSNSISVSISPGSATVMTGQMLQLSASVNGSDNKDVSWSIFSSSASAGTIDSNGLYKAPNTGLMIPVKIQAASVANPTKTAEATVWVLAPGTVSTTNNPMVAQYSMTVPDGGSVKVDFGPDTSYGLDTWTRNAPSGGGPVNILVAGMRMSSTYHMQAVVDVPGGLQFQDVDHTFQTGAPPANLIPQVTVTPTASMTPGRGVEMMGLDVLNPPDTKLEAVVTDLQGNLIWYYEYPEEFTTYAFPFPMREPLPNGDILINLAPGGGGTGGPGDLREIDLAGNTIRDMTTAELNTRLTNAGFSLQVKAISHDVLPLANGHIILLVNYNRQYQSVTMVDDAIVDIDQNWNPVWVWDTFDHLDINRQPESWPDWTHANAILYSPDDGDLIFSMRHQNWIIKIDYQDGKGSGDVLWRLGYQGDFTLKGGTSPQDWFFAQHGPQIISPNSSGIFDMVVFDNGNWRRLDDAGDECGTTGQPACHSRVPVFQVDEINKTATITWVDNLSAYSVFGGNSQQLLNGNIEFDICAFSLAPSAARVMEVTPDPTPQTVWQLDIANQNAYRAFRIPSLYPGVQW